MIVLLGISYSQYKGLPLPVREYMSEERNLLNFFQYKRWKMNQGRYNQNVASAWLNKNSGRCLASISLFETFVESNEFLYLSNRQNPNERQEKISGLAKER
jgi:hypothetical protein